MKQCSKAGLADQIICKPYRRGWFRCFTAILRNKRGAAAVEFGLAAPLLMVLLVPVADLGMAYSQQLQVQQAAQAGAEYATLHPWNRNSPTAIANAVTAANALRGLIATPAPAQVCGCPGGTAIASATCGTTCSNGQAAGYYVIVNAQANYSSALPYSLLPQPTTLSAQSAIRIK